VRVQRCARALFATVGVKTPSAAVDDTIEFFDLVLQTRLTAAEKRDLRAFLYTL
jgi:hypothetical protein